MHCCYGKLSDHLAEMIQEGFQEGKTRLDGIDVRLDHMENLVIEEQKRDIADLNARRMTLGLKTPSPSSPPQRAASNWRLLPLREDAWR
jgi:hypothetical protein